MPAPPSSSQKAQNSASMGGSRGPGGGPTSAPVRTAPSSGAGAGGASSGRTSTGGASKSPSSTSRAPASGGKMGAGSSQTGGAKAPAKTGSGEIGSKGGGASTQKPGAGTGPAKASSIKAPTSRLQAFTAGSDLAATRQTAMKQPAKTTPAKPAVGQGFIKSQAQGLKDQYSQYRSPPGATAPKAPTAGRGITDPRRPTVNAGTSYSNPAGVPASVAKALAARGFNPDGTRMQGPTNPTGGVLQASARTAPSTGVLPARPAAAPVPKVKTPAQNASYFGDMGQPIYKPLAYQARSVFNDWVRDPVGGAIGRTVDGLKRDLGGLAETFMGAEPNFAPGVRNMHGMDATQPGRVPRGLTAPVGPNIADALKNAYDGLSRDIGGFMTSLGNVGQRPGSYVSTDAGVRLVGPDGSLVPASKPITDRIAETQGPIAPRLPKMADRVAPQQRPGYGFPSFDPSSPVQQQAIDRGLSESVTEGFVRSLDPRAQPAAAPAAPITYQGRGRGDAPTAADIAGVGNEDPGIAPASMQNSYRVQRGDTLAKIAAKNGTSVKAIAEANGIQNVNKIREGMTISIPTNATIQPMGGPVEIDIPGAGLPEAAAPRPYPFSNFANESLPPGIRDEMGRLGPSYRDTYFNRPAAESNAPDDPGSVSPSQGEFVSPSQDDRRPQTVREAVQRLRYDRDNAKQGARDLPGRVMQAIIGGQMTNPDGFGNFPAMTGQRNPTEPRYAPSGGVPGMSAAQLMALLAQLQQQQQGITSGQNQMDLINNTFV